jgi:hypothetical protein
MAGVHLMIPRRRDARLDAERLEERYDEFRRAGIEVAGRDAGMPSLP